MAELAFVRIFKVAGFTAEVSIPCIEPGAAASAVVEWSPRVPMVSEFSTAQRAEYQLKLMDAIHAAAVSCVPVFLELRANNPT